jgi:hypothetical protein
MSYRDIHGPITAADAEAEPPNERLFAAATPAAAPARTPTKRISRTTYRPWKKPMIERTKGTDHVHAAE